MKVAEGLFFNNEMAYSIISQLDLEMEELYDLEDKEISFNNYRTKLEDSCQNIKNIIDEIVSKTKVVEKEGGNFERNFSSVKSLTYCDSESGYESEVRGDTISGKYEKDLSERFCEKVEIIYKEE